MATPAEDQTTSCARKHPAPGPGDSEVLLRVRAASITAPANWTGRPPDRPVRRVRYSSGAHHAVTGSVGGVVIDVGPTVSEFGSRDDVYGLIPFLRDGAAAEYVTVSAAVFAAEPPELDHPPCGDELPDAQS
ncbi:hypothetical protein ACFWN1_03405 [Streptomyces sp. NPDC058459]|uniref:hypothetical protein n=1 Tax=Streptomyces sp. NPDC058459 TaxID=3346508 RepID=UPI00366A2352